MFASQYADGIQLISGCWKIANVGGFGKSEIFLPAKGELYEVGLEVVQFDTVALSRLEIQWF